MNSFNLKERWDGPGWHVWTLAAGVGLVLVTALVAQLLAAVVDERSSALLTIGLMAELVVLSFTGSGMLSGTSRRMSRGGLQRETATLDTDYRPAEEREQERAREQERRDRRTMRVGIMALPAFLTFVYLLFR